MLMKAYYFKGNNLITSNTVNKKQKESCVKYFKDLMNDQELTGFAIDFYDLKDFKDVEKDYLLSISLGEIKVEKLVNKKIETNINWIKEPNLNEYYNNEEMQKIEENREALRNFVATEEVPEFEFPHSIPNKTKLIDMLIKERILVETLNPIDSITE